MIRKEFHQMIELMKIYRSEWFRKYFEEKEEIK